MLQIDYKTLAIKARLQVLDMIFKAQSSHVGSNFSCIDLLTVLFQKIDLSKDDIIFSKGWVAASAYYFLSQKGIVPEKDLERFCMPGEEQYIGLVEPGVPGITCAGGSMGYGLGFGVGFALAKKLNKQPGTVYVLMSDGEMDCGTNWEAANIARKLKLDNLVAIVDCNGLQAMGYTEDVLGIDPNNLFGGWVGKKIDGHDYAQIDFAFNQMKKEEELPLVLLARTVKGKGVSFMAGDNKWHYLAPNKEDYEAAKAELCQKL